MSTRARTEATLYGEVPAPPMRLVRPPAEPAATPRHHFGHLSRVECRLLYEMLKSVGADPAAGVLAELVEHMARAERGRARARTIRRRGGREPKGGS
jgi:hypothetical protein